MNNDNHANYAKIGFTVFIGIIAIVGTLIYFGGVGGKEPFLVETYCDKPVSGLSVGSPVNFRGVKVGEVREISFVGTRYRMEASGKLRIYVLMALDRKSLGIGDDASVVRLLDDLVSKGLRATVSASGVTGLSRIECNLHRDAPEPMKISWKPQHYYIPSTVSLLESFSDSATKVMNQINKMDLSTAWSNISASISSLAAATEGVARMVEGHQGKIAKIVENLEEASESIREFADTVKRNPASLLSEDVPERLDETSD
jgi:ABC-type transporter Mla subunit MlaD